MAKKLGVHKTVGKRVARKARRAMLRAKVEKKTLRPLSR
jgi:hypothetical protein